MFIGYGWVLALIDKDLTDGEGFQAWQHGPVLPSVYHEMKRFGNNNIAEYATDYDCEENKTYIPSIQDSRTISVLTKVWNVYKGFTAWSLRNMTHKKDSPWDRTEKSGFTDIDIGYIKDYYISYIDNLLADEC